MERRDSLARRSQIPKPSTRRSCACSAAPATHRALPRSPAARATSRRSAGVDDARAVSRALLGLPRRARSTRRIPSKPRATCAPGSRASALPASTCDPWARTCARFAGSSLRSARARSSAAPSPIAPSSARAWSGPAHAHPGDRAATRSTTRWPRSTSSPSAGDDPDMFVGALRRAKARMTVEVALADLAGEIGTREATLVLSALADATLEQATRFALGAAGAVRGLAVHRGRQAGRQRDRLRLRSRRALRLRSRRALRREPIRTRTSPSERSGSSACCRPRTPKGPGYDLDTRLRPSGSHGLLGDLARSVRALPRNRSARRQPPESGIPAAQQSGAPWERQALVRARFAAGDVALGAALHAHRAHRRVRTRRASPRASSTGVRMRMERETRSREAGAARSQSGAGWPLRHRVRRAVSCKWRTA